ncbi:MAG: tetratricopeptide repeat protein [Rhodocyclales bacterium]|nr:tetratricopeptide repeat protein [Rhodocyclales bacterium]
MQIAADSQSSVDVALGRLARLLGFLEADPDNLNLLADVGDLALECGDLSVARTAAVHALELRPGDPYFSLRLSSVATAEGNFDEALAITGELLAAGVDDPAVRYNRAYALVCLHRFEEAKGLLLSLHAQQALPALVVRLLIRTHHYLGELDEAIAVAQAYLEAEPGNGEIAGMLSLLFVDVDQLPQAQEWAQRALSLVPDNLDALLAASTVALAAEDTDAARALAHRALAVQLRNGRVWSNLGLADMLDFEFDAAHENLTKAVHYMPEHIGTWHLLGWVQMLHRDLDSAEASFQQALALDDNFGETHGALAALAAMRGDWARADEYAKVARRLDPESMYSRYTEVLRLQREGRNDLVARLFDSALREGKAPGGGSLRDMLNRVVSKKRD